MLNVISVLITQPHRTMWSQDNEEEQGEDKEITTKEKEDKR
jgi:hypothetical protein